MKTSLAGIAALPLGFAPELYTIALSSGDMLYFTTHDTDLTYRGQVYQAGAFNSERGVITTKVGVEVCTVDITIYQNTGGTIYGVPLSAFCLNGGFDGAKFKIERARHDRVVWLFDGMVKSAVPDREKAVITVSDPKILLNVNMPRNTITPYCSWSLFDSGCGLDKSAFAHTTSVSSGSNSRILLCGLSQADNYFTLGTITFTSGANAGTSRTIRDYSVGSIALSKALDHPPEVGDTFIAYPGCDKTRATCASVFSNTANIRLFPYVPTPPAAV